MARSLADIQRTIDTVLQAPDVRFFAKDTLRRALTLDPVDAVKDLELVFTLVRARLRAQLEADVRAQLQAEGRLPKEGP